MTQLHLIEFEADELRSIYGVSLMLLDRVCNFEISRYPYFDIEGKKKFISGDEGPRYLNEKEELIWLTCVEILIHMVRFEGLMKEPAFRSEGGRTIFECKIHRTILDCDEDFLHRLMFVHDSAREYFGYFGKDFDRVKDILFQAMSRPRKLRRVR